LDKFYPKNYGENYVNIIKSGKMYVNNVSNHKAKREGGGERRDI